MTSRILRSRGRTDLLPHPLLLRRRRRDPLPQEPDLPHRLLHRRLHPSGSRAARDILGGHRTLRKPPSASITPIASTASSAVSAASKTSALSSCRSRW